MPFTYPSHQGLIAPLWRRWPRAFDVPALCVGAAMPDVIDGLAGLFRGHLGQTGGHSLLGILVCVPAGIVLWAALHGLLRRLPDHAGTGFLSRCWNGTRHAFTGAPGPAAFRFRWRIVTGSMLVGVVSHILFDLISHKHTQLFWPWHANADIFPAWWTVEWWRAPLPLYEGGYSMGPHFAMWMLLNGAGILLLAWPALKKKGTLAHQGSSENAGL